MKIENQIKVVSIIIKIGIIVLMVFAARNMVIGFFAFLRMFCTAGFIFIFFYEYKRPNYIMAFIAFSGAALFNPFYKIILRPHQWRPIDYTVACIVIFWMMYDFIRFTKKNKISSERYNV